VCQDFITYVALGSKLNKRRTRAGAPWAKKNSHTKKKKKIQEEGETENAHQEEEGDAVDQ
jgi:uncharacterized protein YabN with tetrapyrrole methylase and pyrophosphatase domain